MSKSQVVLSFENPQHAPTRGYPSLADHNLRILVLFDDRTTVAKLMDGPIRCLAAGVAKRHPLDKHDPAIGQCIAMARMFRNAASYYVAGYEMHTQPEEDPQADAIKALRKGNRAEAKARKDERRAPARERFKREAAAQHVSEDPYDHNDWRDRVFGNWRK